LIFAIDPGILGDRDEFIRNVGEICRKVKATRKLPDVMEIHLPGERGTHLAVQRLASGEIEIEDNLLMQLRKVAGRV
jgi:LDH2 family malate/lactate/ureidoglycolate dehydrogenase